MFADRLAAPATPLAPSRDFDSGGLDLTLLH